ncbi:hypothetical protein XELAEV_18021156mg [Xenopus laevis]|uniref:Uncharacterized protein n=1 Tax=Xenopus laevis TaxID=8355 RepID=A0A974D8F9_XENLA|nr:hypothetical protein XELAEV_18021156mg [Xenopus laevis]
MGYDRWIGCSLQAYVNLVTAWQTAACLHERCYMSALIWSLALRTFYASRKIHPLHPNLLLFTQSETFTHVLYTGSNKVLLSAICMQIMR